MTKLALNVPDEFRRGGKKEDELASVASGIELIKLMCNKTGRDHLGDTVLLDMGCGNKFVQAILTHDLPLKRYVGIDIHPGLIEFLCSNVHDERFSFYTSNDRNEMYNPEGEPLSEQSRLPVEEGSFDLICLFSVFTHLAPNDYSSMLKLMRRYIKPDGKIIFSLFVNEQTEGGHGFIDNMARKFAEHLSEEDIKKGLEGPADFKDWFPERPLWRAVYSKENALRLVEDTGWEVESLNEPEENIQHYMVCRPV